MGRKTETLPQHIGYIVDGNRRWARARGLPTYEGHLAGYKALREVVRTTCDAGVPYVTAYVFSTENWKRSPLEVSRLLKLLLKMLKTDLHHFMEDNVRLLFVGARTGLSEDIVQAIEQAEATTAGNTGGTLSLCFNYGGQQEIIDAIKQIIRDKTEVEEVNQALIEQHLYSPELPPCDLVLRTGGEQRLSNFMLWRTAFSELLFLKKSWPDMTPEDVQEILAEYAKRDRRFGK